MKLRSFVCKTCGASFERRSGKRVYVFCSRSCAAVQNAEGQRTYEAIHKRWVTKFGVDEADCRLAANKARRREIMVERNVGRVQPRETRNKISASCTGVPNALKGKTFEEFYGHERASELCKLHSQKLKDGYAEGRLFPTARSRSAPVFRGIQLRSLLEQEAIEFLERRDGLVLGETLIHEDKALRVQWIDDAGKQHTYQPDLSDLVNDVVYEVKPAWKVRAPPREMQLKMLALVGSGRRAEYLTDNDMR